ncbi:MAG: adenylate/guanylate cyclase domain-containing protein [Zoogloea oleivorans]|jgi:class 3 adenylate cyclase|uniref:adenylate/guanylate cyclase domain-containing protein n=1 Tax=Zoogloea oleivorans TaxID=1552750 RepID=UPI002A359051|nr:adenylate/guanylate cyclase domain-containing protein [Zoogloea oleivorans]MDY0036856.1 adenylate/guanylate cyclase domain-containing protein [Zoogloea oleivorans]
MPATQATSPFQPLLHAGLLPQDDEEMQLRKSLLNLLACLFTLSTLLWLAIWWHFSGRVPPGMAAIPALAITNYALFARHRHFGAYRFLQLGLLLAFPFVTQWTLGPTPFTSGLGLWALLAPAAALLTIGAVESTPWFLAFLLLSAVSAGIVPQAADPAFTTVHIVLVASVLYPLLRFAVSQRGKTRERLADAHRQLHLEQERSERLLLSILPAPIAARLKDHTGTLADGHPEVVVMFADIVDYTRIASDMPPPKVFEMLNRIFCRFDELTEQRGLERIKTIGDGYMVAGGLYAHPTEAHAAMAALAIDMQAALRDHQFTDGLHLELRIGIASGPVVAGVVGRGKFIYDLWGDTVNLAHRLCTEGEPGMIQCDGRMFERLRGAFVFAKPILLFLKGKGYVPVYRLRNPRILAVPRRRHTPKAA